MGFAAGEQYLRRLGSEAYGGCRARQQVKSQSFVVEIHVDPVPANGELETHSRQSRRKPRREGGHLCVELHAGERSGDEIYGAGHRAEVDTFAGRSSLRVVKVGDERFSKQRP